MDFVLKLKVDNLDLKGCRVAVVAVDDLHKVEKEGRIVADFRKVIDLGSQIHQRNYFLDYFLETFSWPLSILKA